MANTFLYSDPHFGHVGVTKFLNEDGSKLRPWDSVEEMNEDMIKLYNETVDPKDKVYFFGDCVINRKHLHLIGRLNGDKVLIKGNHDIFRLDDYTKYFRDVRAYHVLGKNIFSHIPIHPGQLEQRFQLNFHGHLHSHKVMKITGVDSKGSLRYSKTETDNRYYNVCVEQTGFKPIALETALKLAGH